jgi:site-specific DNA recombinase
LRALINQVRLIPYGEELAIVLRGGLAVILRFAAGK